MNLTAMVSGVQLKNGIETTSLLIGWSFKALGAEIRVSKNYLSTIQGQESPGGTSAYKIRIKDSKIDCIGDDQADILICLGQIKPDGSLPYSISDHLHKVKPGGHCLYDPSLCQTDNIEWPRQDITYLPVPATNLAKDLLGHDSAASIERVRNSAFIGALFWLTGCNDIEGPYRHALEKFFSKPERKEILEQNQAVCAKGFEYISHIKSLDNKRAAYKFNFHDESTHGKLLLTGNEAVALGALAAGAKFYASYPITPASSILEDILKYGPRFGAVGLQAEDEIAAAAMVLGASFTGARAFTATSGPGFSLMAEMISHSGMVETPLVIVLTQRAGPSTGMPTKTEQSDLATAIYGHNGEIPIVVIAPGDASEAFNAMLRAFYLAEKYQCPIVIMGTLELSESWQLVEPFNPDLVKEYLGKRIQPVPAKEANAIVNKHQLTGNGLSPLFLPQYSGIVKTNGAEHTEEGSVTTQTHIRKALMQKRMKKIETFLKEDARGPSNYGSADAKIALIGWGDTKGALREASQILEIKYNLKTKVFHFSDIWPFPAKKTLEYLHPEDLNIVFENNYTGQLADLLILECAKAGTLVKLERYNRYDGKVLEPSEIVEAVIGFTGGAQ